MRVRGAILTFTIAANDDYAYNVIGLDTDRVQANFHDGANDSHKELRELATDYFEQVYVYKGGVYSDENYLFYKHIPLNDGYVCMPPCPFLPNPDPSHGTVGRHSRPVGLFGEYGLPGAFVPAWAALCNLCGAACRLLLQPRVLCAVRHGNGTADIPSDIRAGCRCRITSQEAGPPDPNALVHGSRN